MQCMHQITLKSGDSVPCGRCPSCLANQRSEWIFRLFQEFKVSEFSVFVTLTYDDEHVPADYSVNKKDVQDFHKRLRKHFPPGDLRYYLVSEYGDHTFRPHYHGLYFFKSKYNLDLIYNVFESSWKNGFIKFGEVETGSIVYCTKYCLKHSTTPAGRKPTFRLVSKMQGGLGSNYLDLMSDYHKQTKNFISVYENGKRFRMPRYFRSILDEQAGSKCWLVRDRRFFDRYENARQCFEKEYFRYLSTRGLRDSEEARTAFSEFRNSVGIHRDELVVKHCKKQIM